MNIKKVIKFYFNPKSVMSSEEIEGKKTFPVQSKFYKSLSKAEKTFYWLFRLGFIAVLIIVTNYLLDIFFK
tara:strand:- start:3313 stop:3525 length:213 start_codon:yes stop_codon:yes gene_type:complete